MSRIPRPAPLPALLASLALLLAPAVAAAQAAPLVVEVRGGASVPVLSFADGDRPGEGVGGGPSLSVEFAFSGSSRRTLTVGFSQHRFACEDAGCAANEEYVATGMNLGLRLNLATTGDVIPWIRLGGRSVRVELPERGTRPAGTSKLGFGGEAGVGIYIGTFRSLALNPGFRVAAVNTRLPGGETLRMRYWVADLGFALAF